MAIQVQQTFIKDPDANLDYTVSWVNWLSSPEQIASVSWSVDAGITISTTSNTTTTATIWLSGGSPGVTYNVHCKITTNSTPARIDERTFAIRVRQR